MSTDVTPNPGWAAWRDNFDACLVGYVEALLWTSCCMGEVEHDDCPGEDCDMGLDDLGYTWGDFTPGAAAEIEEDLHGFVTSCLAERPDAFDGLDAAQVGHDFCLTRQGQGVGFWDRGLGERGEWLTGVSKPFGTMGAMVDCDGELCVHG